MTEEIKNKWNYLILTVAIVCMAVVSCQSYLDMVTPVHIPDRSMKYAEVEPNDIGFPTLSDAKEIRDTIMIKHRNIQIGLIRMTNDDKAQYQDARNLVTANIEEAEEFQDLIVGSANNPFSLLGLIGPGFAGLYAGKLLKRKGDFTPEEVEVEKEKAKNGGTA